MKVSHMTFYYSECTVFYRIFTIILLWVIPHISYNFMYILPLHCIYHAPSRILGFWLMLSFLCAAINKSYLIVLNNQVARDLKRYDTHLTMTSHGCHVVSNHGHSTVCLTAYADPHHLKKLQRPHQWPFVRGIHRWPVNSPHKGPVTRKKAPICSRHHHTTSL